MSPPAVVPGAAGPVPQLAPYCTKIPSMSAACNSHYKGVRLPWSPSASEWFRLCTVLTPALSIGAQHDNRHIFTQVPRVFVRFGFKG